MQPFPTTAFEYTQVCFHIVQHFLFVFGPTTNHLHVATHTRNSVGGVPSVLKKDPPTRFLVCFATCEDGPYLVKSHWRNTQRCECIPVCVRKCSAALIECCHIAANCCMCGCTQRITPTKFLVCFAIFEQHRVLIFEILQSQLVRPPLSVFSSLCSVICVVAHKAPHPPSF
jgi:hypothetical protein